MSSVEIIAEGLAFPEGPIAMPDGSVLVVEIAAGQITKINPDGSKEVLATPGGGPNGMAFGPDGALYICNNGGFEYHYRDGLCIPGDIAKDYSGGRIERLDLETGKLDVLYTECGAIPLNGPNDIVFDKHGGFWFTDLGKTRGRIKDVGALFYAKPDGSMIREAVFPIESPNGVGLSPDEDVVYVADTVPGRLWAFDIVEPGVIAKSEGPLPGRFVGGPQGLNFFDSLAVDSEGNVCVATIFNGGITSIAPDGSQMTHMPFDDFITTNICFGGADLKTAYVTLSSTGRLAKVQWPVAGLPLNFHDK